MIHVIATITAKPGRRAELLALFLRLLPIVRAEAGCIEYRPLVDNDAGLDGARESIGGDTYIVLEKWASEAALDAHAATEHMRKFGDAARGVIARRTLHVMRDASA